MEMIKKLSKKPIVWIVAVAVILGGTLAVFGWDNITGAADQMQTDANQNTPGNAAVLGDDQSAGNAGVQQAAASNASGNASGANNNTGNQTQDDLISGGIAIQEKLTWEGIQSFPVKTADMTIAEARQLCVDFFRYTKTALWTPDEEVRYVRNGSGTEDSISAGIIYSGLPYVTLGTGNVYRLMDYIDESTGVVDVRGIVAKDADLSQILTAEQMKYFGNQCSIGAYWGWGRVINSPTYKWTEDMTPYNGFIPVGNYTSTTEKAWGKTNTTKAAVEANGQQKMYAAYAQLQPADGLVTYTDGGHTIMCASNAVVTSVNGTIDGNASYITIIDQAQTWTDASNSSGDNYTVKNSVDLKMTFAQLYAGGYIPFTFAEWQGTDPIEETVASFSHCGSTITKSQLFSATVEANYGISDVYAIVTNAQGEEVYRHAVRAIKAGMTSLSFVESQTVEGNKTYQNVDTWGTLSGGTYTVEVVVQLATGERPTLYTGKLVV